MYITCSLVFTLAFIALPKKKQRKISISASTRGKNLQYLPDQKKQNKNPNSLRFLFRNYALIRRIQESLFSCHWPVFQMSLFLYFPSDKATTRQQRLSLLPAKRWNSCWWKCWPIKHRFHWWHNRKNGFFFSKTFPRPLFTPSDESSLVAHEDADFLTRCEGHDSQIIWLKERRRFYCDPCAFQSSVTMWSAAPQLKGERKQYLYIRVNSYA